MHKFSEQDIDDMMASQATLLRGNMSLFDYKATLKFLDYLKEKDVGILGLESFILEDVYIIPQDIIIDSSQLYIESPHAEFVERSIEFTRKVLLSEQEAQQYFFEFVLAQK